MKASALASELLKHPRANVTFAFQGSDGEVASEDAQILDVLIYGVAGNELILTVDWGQVL